MIRTVEFIGAMLYPFVNVIAWGIVLYQNARYKKRIVELERFKKEMIAALNLPYQEEM